MMKKLIVQFQAMFLIALGAVFYGVSCSSETAAVKSEVKLPAQMTSDDIVVYYNQDSLFAKSVYMLSLKNKIETDIRTIESSLNAEKAQYESWAGQQEEWVAKGLLSQAEIEKTRGEAARKQQALMDRSQRAEKSFTDMQMAINDKLQVAIDTATKVLNKDKKIKFVLVYSKSTPYLHPMETAVDITKQLVSLVDEIYKDKK